MQSWDWRVSSPARKENENDRGRCPNSHRGRVQIGAPSLGSFLYSMHPGNLGMMEGPRARSAVSGASVSVSKTNAGP